MEKRCNVTKKKCFLFFLFFVFASQISLQAYCQEVKLTFSLKNATLEEIVDEIKRISTYDFVYSDSYLSVFKPRDVSFKNATIDEVLSSCLKDSGLVYTINGRTIIIKRGKKTEENNRTVSGKVTDVKGNPLPGVTILSKGITVGTATGADGSYKLEIPSGKVILIYSFIGMKTQYVTVTDNLKIDVKLEEDVEEVEEVVVTGYQTINKRRSTSAISSVKAEDILVPGMTSIDQALEGRIPDLQLMLNSGEVGATPRIRVRGTSTLSGNRNPLWVLDGFVLSDPVNVSPEDLNNPDYINIIGNAIAGINPQDIERIDVLKDASATALYGTQAANGVIVVTTKRGKAGKISLSYSHSSKITRRPRYTDRNINLMNSQERMQFGKDLVDNHYIFDPYMPTVGYEGAYYNWMSGKTSYDEFLTEVRQNETINTDWFDILTRDAYSQTHNLSMSGGSEKVCYYASFGISDDNGVAKTSYSDRYSIMLNLDAKLSDKFQVALRLNGNIQKKNHVPAEIDAMGYAYNTTRALPCFNSDGSLYYYKKASDTRNTRLNYNIINEINNSSQEYDGSTTMISMDLRYDIMKSWNLTIAGSYTRSNTTQTDWWGEKTWKVASLRNAEAEDTPPTGESGYCYLPYGGILTTNQSAAENWTLRLQSNYSKGLDKEAHHLLSASLGLEANSSKNQAIADESRGYLKERGKQFVDMSTSTSVNGKTTYLIDDYPYFKNWLAAPHHSISESLTNKLSGYLTVSYSYKDYFTFNVNGRFDVSNQFGSESNNKLLPVWSISTMLNLKDIIFLDSDGEYKGGAWISDMRLRMSYGKQGNMIDGETPDMLLNQGGIDTYYGEYVSTLYKLPNPNLRWEQTNQINIGLNLDLFNSRLNISTDFYYKKTNELLSSIAVSSVNGTPSGTYVMNNGTLSNKGMSISLSGYPIRTKNFSWFVSTYYSINLNEVQSQPLENYTKEAFLDGTAIISGKPISTFYSYKFLGLDHETGLPMFDDWEDRVHLLYGKSVAEIIMTVLEDSGCRDPFISGSFSNNIRYKRWNLSFNLAYSLGSKVRLFDMYGPIQNGITSVENVRKEFIDRWVVPGDELRTNYPALLSPSDPLFDQYRYHYSMTAGSQGLTGPFADNIWQMYDDSDIRVVSGNYLKMQSLSLRYDVPEKILKKLPISYASISFSTQNLFTISAKELKGQDPSQAGFSSPNLSVRPSYTIGVNLSF